MFRIVRVSATRLPGRYNGGTSRLYRTMRYYSKEQQRSEICPPPPPKKTYTGTALTFGTIAVLSGAIIGYAKYDPDFRCYLTEYVPFTDNIIKFVFEEEKSYKESIQDIYNGWKAALFPAPSTEGEQPTKGKKKITDIEKDYKPPTPVLAPIGEATKVPAEVYSEVRLEGPAKGDGEPEVEIVGPKPETDVPDTHPKNLAELEKSTADAAKIAIDTYTKAINALRHYIIEVESIVDQSVHQLGPSAWESLKEQTAARDAAINSAEKEAKHAIRDYNKLKELLKKTEFDVKESVKEQALRNIEAIAAELKQAKEELEEEKVRSSVTERYWKKVLEARTHFGDELGILFPETNIQEKKLNIGEGDLDLFVLHAMAKVLYYQKELKKLETVGSERLNKALEQAKKSGADVLSTEQICAEVEKEKRLLETEFNKKCLKMMNDSQHEIRSQLKRQSMAFSDHLDESVRVREAELEKELTRRFNEKLYEERCDYKEKLAAMIGRLRGLDHSIRARADGDKTAHQAQVLWAACQALYRAVKAGCPGFPWNEQIRPLDSEIKAVKLAASEHDELVKSVLEGIPPTAKNRGVYPEDALRERFLKVEKMARGLALVPESGGRLHLYLLSYIQSFLLLKAANPIPQSELNDDETDFSKLSTYDILQRARYWIDRGDFSQTLKYMNLLQGAPRAVARQWMEETRIMLETQQAATTLMAHATASGLLHL